MRRAWKRQFGAIPRGLVKRLYICLSRCLDYKAGLARCEEVVPGGTSTSSGLKGVARHVPSQSKGREDANELKRDLSKNQQKKGAQ